MSEPKKLTIKEAQAMLVELRKNKDYIEPLINPRLRNDLEINVDPAPEYIHKWLVKEYEFIKADIQQIQDMITKAMETEPLIDVTDANYRHNSK